jgi:hypothetical protein
LQAHEEKPKLGKIKQNEEPEKRSSGAKARVDFACLCGG